MAELALRTSELKVQKAEYLAWKPDGSAVVCQSDHTICRKWLEICCDLVSPAKRDTYRSLPGWRRLCEAWTPELRQAWLEADRPTPEWKLSRLLQDHTFSAQLWNTLIAPIGVAKDLPLAPESDVPVHKTWLWSETERKRFYIVANADASSPTVESWNGQDMWDMTLDALDETEGYKAEVPDRENPGRTIEVTLLRRVNPEHPLLIRPRKRVDYRTEIGLPGAVLDKIADPAATVHPDFSAPVASEKVRQPDVRSVAVAREVIR